MKATAIAPSNIAFIKYWGKRDEALRLPANASISMNLSNLTTTTTVEFASDYKHDDVLINKQRHIDQSKRVTKHLDKIRKLAKVNLKAKVVSENSFPSSTGLSSSASGFAALTLAATKALNLRLSEKELSILARLGSGSACRSIPDGFVEWLGGKTNNTSYARSIFPADYWDIIDIVAIVSKEKKAVSTTQGQTTAASSPFFQTRIRAIPDKIKLIKILIKRRNFVDFGNLIEAEALELHAIMLTSCSALIYLQPETLMIMKLVKQWRQQGIPVFFTINTGQDIHLICEQKNTQRVTSLLKDIKYIKRIIVNKPAKGVRLTDKHLF